MTDLVNRLKAALGDAYRIERELGGGGMSRVFEAVEQKLGRRVVLKVLPPELTAEVSIGRFRQEIHLAASLQHPHIVPLLTADSTGEMLYYVMPLIEGESLRTRLARGGELPIPDAIRLLRDVADALAYAHVHGVVHRDVKPDNVMIAGHHALVTDFGVAKALSAATGESHLTSTGVAVGTPAYMAPEQAAGDPHVDHRADIYALGALAYEMLTGRPPFVAGSIQGVLAAQVSQSPDPVTKHRTAVPVALAELVGRCLEKHPADRWQSAEELLHVLESMVTPTSVSTPARRAIGGPTASSYSSTPRWVWATVTAIALVALALGVWRPWKRNATATAGAVGDVASVAVMPFDNLSGNPNDSYLSDGMTDEIIGQLTQVPRLKVISRTSVVALKGSGLTTRQIADTLGVRHLLEGSVRRAANRVRVSVDLIDARTDAHVWANSYERDLTDVFRVQEDIARQVVEALAATVGGLPAASPASHTDQPVAYAAYLRGKYLLHRRTAEGLRGAIREFTQAITIDSAYAPAYAGLASAYGLTATYDYAGIDLYVAYGRAIAMADRALAIDSNFAEAYAARGYVETRAWAPIEPIGRDFKRALARRPNSADVHGWYAHYLSRVGRHAEALAEAERAIELDPLAPGRRVGIAIDALGARRYDVAEREAESALTLEPSLTTPRYHLALARLLRGDPQRCLEGSLGPFEGVRALCLHSLGRTREAATIVDSLRVLAQRGGQPDSTHSPVIPVRSLATYYAWVGDVPQTLLWLERAYALSPEGEDFRVMTSGVYDRVLTDPHFRNGLEQIRRDMYDHLQRETLKAKQSPP